MKAQHGEWVGTLAQGVLGMCVSRPASPVITFSCLKIAYAYCLSLRGNILAR